MMHNLKRVLPWVHYPLVVIAVFSIFAWLQSRGISLIVSTYVPVLFAAGAVTILEFAFPNRAAWRPPTAEIKTDLVFMTTIQLALPPLVSFLFVYLLIEPTRSLDLPITRLWPHGWPITSGQLVSGYSVPS